MPLLMQYDLLLLTNRRPPAPPSPSHHHHPRHQTTTTTTPARTLLPPQPGTPPHSHLTHRPLPPAVRPLPLHQPPHRPSHRWIRTDTEEREGADGILLSQTGVDSAEGRVGVR